MRAAFEIAGKRIDSGQRDFVAIPLPGLQTQTPMSMQVQVVHGRRDGPCLFLSAAVHGDEINGVEIIRRILGLPALKQLRGTLIAVPIVNVYGFHNHSRYLPDRRDLNRQFPGSQMGSMAGRLANIFLSQIVTRADLGIDLHSAAIHRANFPQIRADLNDPHLKPLARAFGSAVLLHSAPPEGSLRGAAAGIGVPVMVYEGGEALRFDEDSIRVGVAGIVNVMRALHMLPLGKDGPVRVSGLLKSSVWVRASQSGILRDPVNLGRRVSKEDRLGVIADPSGLGESVVSAIANGIIIGRTNIPLVYEGEALFHIARTSEDQLLEGLADGEVLTPPELIEEPPIV